MHSLRVLFVAVCQCGWQQQTTTRQQRTEAQNSNERRIYLSVGMSKTVTTFSSLLSCAACGSSEDAILDEEKDLIMDTTPDRSLLRSRSSERVTESAGSDLDESVGSDYDQFEDSERAAKRGVHRRSMSDPCLDRQDEQEDDLEQQNGAQDDEFLDAVTSHSAHVATLPRYPVRDTRNKNCFSEPPVSIFHVRGPSYFRDKKKIKSGPYLLTARGCDLFLMDNKGGCVLKERTHEIMGGQLRREPTLAVNFRFPWGYLNMYFEIPEILVGHMNPEAGLAIDSSLSSAEKCLAAWLKGDTDYRNDRLKLIPYVAEGPWVVRNMVTGRPAIIGRKLPVTYDLSLGTETQAPLLTATLDIGSSSATAKRIVSVCRRYMASLTVDIGFVIQAEEEEELPEQMMGSIRVHHADPLKAPKLV